MVAVIDAPIHLKITVEISILHMVILCQCHVDKAVMHHMLDLIISLLSKFQIIFHLNMQLHYYVVV